MHESLRKIWQSRLFRLTNSVLMLTVSVLLLADFLELRGNTQAELRESRKAVAEALAVQITVLASTQEPRVLHDAVQAFVERSDDLIAIAVTRADRRILAQAGDADAFSDSDVSSIADVRVPIFQQGQRWGEVRVAFVKRDLLMEEFGYFAFVAACCFALYLLFLRKALNQIDPSQVVPGRVNSAFNLLSEAIVILDTKMQVMLANESMARLLGRKPEELLGQRIDEWPWVHDRDPLGATPWSIAIEAGSYAGSEPLKLHVEQDRTRSLMVNCAAVGSSESRTRGVLVAFDDLTPMEEKNQELAQALRLLKHTQVDLLKKNEELQALATQDPLTGVANRRALLARLESDFLRARREQLSLACMMVDIDHFKKINDTFGHVVGDDVIRAVADTLTRHCREYDIVGRYGGEEFLLVLPGLDVQQAIPIAERIRVAIGELCGTGRLPLDHLSASLGIACMDPQTKDCVALIDHADQALYTAKQGGRNRVCVYDLKVIRLFNNDGATLPVETFQAIELRQEFVDDK